MALIRVFNIPSEISQARPSLFVLFSTLSFNKVRVLITTVNGADSWTTVGVSEDVIEASWIALTDAIDYALLQNN